MQHIWFISLGVLGLKNDLRFTMLWNDDSYVVLLKNQDAKQRE